jgi:hypothetical protein
MPMPPQLVGKAVHINLQPNQRKGNGRKPKLIRKWIKECNVEKNDARLMMNSLLHAYTVGGLKILKKTENDKVAAATYTMISSIINAAKKGDIKPLLEMYEFIFGKDEQKISVTSHSPEYVQLKDALLKNALKDGGREAVIEELEKAAGGEDKQG